MARWKRRSCQSGDGAARTHRGRTHGPRTRRRTPEDGRPSPLRLWRTRLVRRKTMNRQTIKKTALVLFAVIALLAVGAAAGLWWERNHVPADGKAMPATAAKDGRSVLYWYDPMVPTQKFDKPGKSPFMDMQLVPKYADEGGDASPVTIDPGVAQNLGVRLATVTRALLVLFVVFLCFVFFFVCVFVFV